MANSPCSDLWVDLIWPVMGDRIKADCGYRFYSALVDQYSQFKEIDWQLGGICGELENGWIKLGTESTLHLRVPGSIIADMIILDGQIIRIGQSFLQLGMSEGSTIQPHKQLFSRNVTIKTSGVCRTDPFTFGVSLGKKLEKLKIESIPKIIPNSSREMLIRDTRVISYGIRFEELTPQDSIVLQSFGLGGRRKMGYGVFSS